MNNTETFYNNLLGYFGTITTVIMIVPILVFLKNRKSQLPFMYIFYWGLWADLLVALVEQIVIFFAKNSTHFANFIHSFGINSTNFLAILNYLYSFLVVGYFYKKILANKLGNLLFIGSIILTLASIFIYLFVDGFNNQPSTNMTVSRIFTIVSTLFVLKHFSSHNLGSLYFKNSYVLVTLAMLLPAAISMALGIYSNQIYQTNYIFFVQLSILRNLINIIALTLIVTAFYRPSY